jgi:hypothetical protein
MMEKVTGKRMRETESILLTELMMFPLASARRLRF